MAGTKTTLQKVNQDEKSRVLSQMKGHDKTAEKHPNKVEIGNLPEKECRISIVMMIQNLGKRKIEKMQERPRRTKEETEEQFLLLQKESIAE